MDKIEEKCKRDQCVVSFFADGEGENVADESKDGAVTESAATAAESAVAGSAAGNTYSQSV